MKKNKIYFADLTHTAQGVSASTFPLGASFVVSYAAQKLGHEFDFTLFKFPKMLDEALKAEMPLVLSFSNYSWNFELSYKVASLAKARNPKLVTVFGGPNFPIDEDEKREFLAGRPAIDFYVQLEGELGFVDLIEKLGKFDFDAAKLKAAGEKVINTVYLAGDQMVSGPTDRIKDINLIPSPYLTGILDQFFTLPLQPMIETTRGCPFSCTFCADGMSVKNKVTRFAHERTWEELNYIASRVKNVDELIITDLNFAMYEEDLVTARYIAQIKEKFNWPVLVGASAGKNRPLRTIEAAGILAGTWTLGASLQSTDPDVLKAIKRSNISSAAYKDIIDYGNSLKNSKSHSEIILALPGDTKEKHYQSLRFGIDHRVTHLRMFQAMLLRGTDMATQATREKYGLITKFRTIPGCVGMYNLFGEEHPVSEIEEIIVGNNTLPFEDYVECRIMNLLVETFYNNVLFGELFGMCKALGVSIFDCLLYIKNHDELYSPRVKEIIKEFIRQTSINLFDSFEEAQKYVLTPEIIGRYIGGELGINELLVHKSELFRAFGDICDLIFIGVHEVLKDRGLLTKQVDAYLTELKTFTLLKKKDCITDTKQVSKSKFIFDINAFKDSGFEVDPNQLTPCDPPIEYTFYHDSTQQKHISNQLNIYQKTPIGLGRLLQRSNLKLMYRTVEPSVMVAQNKGHA